MSDLMALTSGKTPMEQLAIVCVGANIYPEVAIVLRENDWSLEDHKNRQGQLDWVDVSEILKNTKYRNEIIFRRQLGSIPYSAFYRMFAKDNQAHAFLIELDFKK